MSRRPVSPSASPYGAFLRLATSLKLSVVIVRLANEKRHTTHTVGRDKLLRTLQYFSRFYAWYLLRANHPVSAIAPFEAIKKQFGLTRKLLRVGKNVEHFKAAAIAADSKNNMDPVLRYCAVGRQLGYAVYLSLDTVAYVCLVLSLLFFLYPGECSSGRERLTTTMDSSMR